jgi:hypothetical protein
VDAGNAARERVSHVEYGGIRVRECHASAQQVCGTWSVSLAARA